MQILNKYSMADWTDKIAESQIRKLLRYNPKYYFAGGLPGAQPSHYLKKILQEITNEIPDQLVAKLPQFNYGATEGIAPLRDILAQRLVKREGIYLPLGKDNVSITTGSQQCLYGIMKVLLNPGDVVITSRPTYLGFIGAAQTLGAIIITIPSDEDGIIPEAISAVCEQVHTTFGKQPKIIYVQTFSENPSGITLPIKRRQQIYDEAVENGLLILEDVAYKEIQQNPSSIVPIKQFDKTNSQVIYSATTSKETAILRIGYSVMPYEIQKQFLKLKGFMDLCSPSLNQEIALRYYRDHIDEALKPINEAYNKQRDAMKKAVDAYLPGTRTDPIGGFFLWYKQEGINTKDLLDVALKNDLLYVPGDSFYPNSEYQLSDDLASLEYPTMNYDQLRLSFSATNPFDIKEGIQKLAKVLLKP